MNISKPDFDRAAGQVPLSEVQTQEFWRLLSEVVSSGGAVQVPARRFDVANVAYYFGALIIMGAMGWFMTNAWEAFGGLGIFLIAAAYALVFATVGGWLWKRSPGGLHNLGGLLVTVAVAMTPLMIYGLQRWTGWWTHADPGSYAGFHEWIKGGWVWMELGTVVAGTVALRFVRFPFLTAPIAFALWYLSMDLTPVVFGVGDTDFTWTERLRVSLGFGAVNLGELSEKDVLAVLALVQKDYSVDPKRSYLMGHSMGGGGTLYLGMKYPERWAALAALAPAIYSNPDSLEAIRQMPVMVVQGDQDRLVHVENTRRWVTRMKELKMDYRYVEIPGGDHIFSVAANPAMIGEVFDFFDHHSK